MAGGHSENAQKLSLAEPKAPGILRSNIRSNKSAD
jgi:hypothetical protein